MAAVLIILFLLWTLPAEACPVCFSAKGESRNAYYLTTVLLGLLPLLLITGIALWLRPKASPGKPNG